MKFSVRATFLLVQFLVLCGTKSSACTEEVPKVNTVGAKSDGNETDAIFDVTTFGAKPDGNDSTAAFLDAWVAACQFKGQSSLVIPVGTFMLGPIAFTGPCHNRSSPIVEIKGKVKALSSFANATSTSKKWPRLLRSWIKFSELNKLLLRGGGTLDGQGSLSWPLNTCDTKKKCLMPPSMLSFHSVSNSMVSELSLVDSKAFHVKFRECNNIDVSGLRITSPEDSPNTDGIHVGITNNITISSSVIGTGDDCISIGPGSTNVIVYNVTCGPGHGISIGSLGKDKGEMDVVGVQVKNCTIKNTDNGVRIKTWPGSPKSRASNFTFEDILMVNASNPIIIDQHYCPLHGCTNEPSKVEISNVTFNGIRGTSKTKVAVKILCSKDYPCKDVEMLDINLTYAGGADRNTTASCVNVNGSSSGMQIPKPCLARG